MAEYVRRRRPPANHPYWQHLHDRAHPPWIVIPVGIPTFIGLGIGLYAGLRPSLTMAEVIRAVGVGAAGLGATSGVIVTASQVIDAIRQPSRRNQWAATVIAGIRGLCVGVVLFVVSYVAMFPFVAWYAACSGEGPWLGMLYGALIGATPVAMIVFSHRQRWRDRQKHWPRWDRMRVPRTGISPTLPQLSNTSIPSTSSVSQPAGESARNAQQPGSELTPPPPIGETREET
jgi:hypothetical protein